MSAPPKWSSVDKIVQAQVERTRELDRRSREASVKAREASESVAAVEREDQARRASALAEGAKSDPGRNAEAISAAEREATEAAEAAAILADAYAQARAKLDAVCDERAPEWEAAARERIERAVAELDAAIEVVRVGYGAWVEARRQRELATSEVARRKSAAREVELPGLRGEGGHAVLVSDALAALARLTDPAPVEVEPEPEPLSDDERRAFVASGGVVLGPGRG